MSKCKNAVYQAVFNSHDHPTADVVLARAKNVVPTINIASVYRNLNALVKEGKVRKIEAVGGDRFDKTLFDHAHFQCSVCGKVEDVLEIDVKPILAIAKLSNNDIIDTEINFRGVCSNCKG
ncbi:MAG: transcriptional repressor [Clostridia bacterium]|nr:transcriptional repressor [Clostridia bacterium]